MYPIGSEDLLSAIILQISDETEVLVAGDPERQHMALCDTRGGIPYHPNQIQFGVGICIDSLYRYFFCQIEKQFFWSKD